ncbi:hypothetical protein PV08_07657 [Exophiala spinifera]|uniref:FAD/NAD(P)-binding domain-containing protein n=1 Tax=Exophiala spinifera TaxID=91928 RepID=A0A0D1ZPX8_9EURO|nr:uncharacterized protein PV08_07657 [Exophiala spinifera]KIW14872.1 hypothetical protein PV08_07657 [Exophiala spinifera]
MLKKLLFYCKLMRFALSLGLERVGFLVLARIHRLTYKAVPNPKNVVVVGGSFAGFFLAKELADSLPTGYRVIVIEKHSHYYFTWNFPRVTVVEGHTQNAFVPYPDESLVQPAGVYSFRQGEVVDIGDGQVTLADGTIIPFEFLAIATGSNARYPAEMDADNKFDCIAFFEKQQQRIKAADHIVIVGAGAAGVEVAGDIMTTYKNKKVTLVHSRQQLLNKFGNELHNVAKKGLEDLGVELVLGDRVVAGLDSDGPAEIRLQSGKVLQADMLIRSTGQHPESTLVKKAFPSAISPSGNILVEKTLQIKGCPPNIFACGDVIDLPGPRLGRAATYQGMFVGDNIVRSIKGKPLKEYKPGMIDASIDLTLGVGNNVTYINDAGDEMTFPTKMPDVNLHAAQAWKVMYAKPFEDPGYTPKKVAELADV